MPCWPKRLGCAWSVSELDKRENTASHVLARFRGFIQAAATLVTNIHLPNFAKGSIYQGAGKTVCVPGLNCYSCPAASGACPIGSFQSVVGSSKFNFSYYVTGTLILLGVLLGRFVCGFLCPFGWLQELLHKIPGKKFSTKKLKPLTYIKYVVLLFAVVAAACVGGQRSWGWGTRSFASTSVHRVCSRAPFRWPLPMPAFDLRWDISLPGNLPFSLPW